MILSIMPVVGRTELLVERTNVTFVAEKYTILGMIYAVIQKCSKMRQEEIWPVVCQAHLFIIPEHMFVVLVSGERAIGKLIRIFKCKYIYEM